MKSGITIFIAVLMLGILQVNAQNKEVYTTSSGEMIFSFANINNNGDEKGNIMRWTPAFNFQNLVNYDVSHSFGLFTGLNIKNVGFIYDVPNTNIRKKFRNYTLGIPVGIKIGQMDKMLVYGGYEIEFPLNYKEKTFENEVKTDKFNVWFSKRVPAIYHTVMVGIQLPYGANLKFKYYLTNFFNKDYKETKNGVETLPYKDFDANIFYFSLCFDLFKNDKPVNPMAPKDTKYASLY